MIWIIVVTTLILLLPIIGIGVVSKFGMNLFEEPEFWYSYMSYFGAVVLGAIAVWQNKNAQKVNEKLTKENNNLQKIMVQKMLPIVKVESVKTLCTNTNTNKISKTKLPSKNSYSLAIVQKIHLGAQNNDAIQDSRDLRVIKVNVDADDNALFEKEVTFSINNISDTFIRHIEIEKIEISGYKGAFEYVVCNNEIKGNGISELLSFSDTVNFKMKFFFNDKQKKECWDNILGGIAFTIYLTSTSINGIKFNEYIYIDVSNEGVCKTSYGEWDLQEYK